MSRVVPIINKLLNKHTPFVITAKTNFDEDVKLNVEVFEKLDYVRVMTFNLIINEIKDRNLSGNVAELGVYKGKFAKLINQCFPEKKLFLFDTFKGFDKTNFAEGIEQKIVDKVLHDFDDTSVAEVLEKMPFKNQCVVKQGLFPDTITGCENENFCFVSIDADLYKPIYDGLNFFYSRLVKGGYIMVHDYNNKEYKGAKQAVQKFAIEQDVSYTPISDGWGTVIFTK